MSSSARRSFRVGGSSSTSRMSTSRESAHDPLSVGRQGERARWPPGRARPRPGHAPAVPMDDALDQSQAHARAFKLVGAGAAAGTRRTPCPRTSMSKPTPLSRTKVDHASGRRARADLDDRRCPRGRRELQERWTRGSPSPGAAGRGRPTAPAADPSRELDVLPARSPGTSSWVHRSVRGPSMSTRVRGGSRCRPARENASRSSIRRPIPRAPSRTTPSRRRPSPSSGTRARRPGSGRSPRSHAAAPAGRARPIGRSPPVPRCALELGGRSWTWASSSRLRSRTRRMFPRPGRLPPGEGERGQEAHEGQPPGDAQRALPAVELAQDLALLHLDHDPPGDGLETAVSREDGHATVVTQTAEAGRTPQRLAGGQARGGRDPAF